MLKVLVITHGKIGQELISTAELITGKQDSVEAIELSSNESLAVLSARIEEKLKTSNQSEGVLILTDMLGGTPCNASLPFSKKYNIEIISGVNLYMLISVFLNRDKIGINELTQKIIAEGKKSIEDVKKIFLKKIG